MEQKKKDERKYTAAFNRGYMVLPMVLEQLINMKFI